MKGARDRDLSALYEIAASLREQADRAVARGYDTPIEALAAFDRALARRCRALSAEVEAAAEQLSARTSRRLAPAARRSAP